MAMMFANLKAARKGLKLPGGQNAYISSYGGVEEYSWSKRGGYADGVLDKLRSSLRTARWKQSDSNGFGNPDGSVMGNSNYWTKGGWIVGITESYGGIKWDNNFYVTMKKVKVNAPTE